MNLSRNLKDLNKYYMIAASCLGWAMDTKRLKSLNEFTYQYYLQPFLQCSHFVIAVINPKLPSNIFKVLPLVLYINKKERGPSIKENALL